MAAPVITCPACTKKFKGKDGLEGKRIKCPLCATPFVVTSEQIKAGAPAGGKDGGPIKLQDEKTAAPSMMKHQRVSWNKEDEDHTAYKLGQFDLRARCPNCANLMESEEAIICVFCGYNTQTRTWGSTVRTTSVTAGQHILHLLPGVMFFLLLIIFVVGILMFCLDLPPYVVGSSWAWVFDHESLRMWTIGISLFFMWAFGYLTVKRLVLNPKPQELEKASNATAK